MTTNQDSGQETGTIYHRTILRTADDSIGVLLSEAPHGLRGTDTRTGRRNRGRGRGQVVRTTEAFAYQTVREMGVDH